METGGYNRGTFISVLQSCENQIGHQKSYGEIKAFVLSQAIKFLHGKEAYIFCSDDFGPDRDLRMVHRYHVLAF